MVVKMESVPADAGSNNHVPNGWCKSLNDRLSVVTFGHASNVIIVIDRLTGERRKITFPPAERVAKKTRNQKIVDDIKEGRVDINA